MIEKKIFDNPKNFYAKQRDNLNYFKSLKNKPKEPYVVVIRNIILQTGYNIDSLIKYRDGNSSIIHNNPPYSKIV